MEADRKLFAVIVSWNPDLGTMRTMLAALKTEGLDAVIISDNRSKPEVQKDLRTLAAEFPGFVSIVWNEANLGMGGGLNRGVTEALKRGANWIMTLEGDNYPQPGMVAKMFAAYDALSDADKALVAKIAPNLTTQFGLAFSDKEANLNDNGAITSGEIVKASTYPIVGMYDEDLFIDHVDSEFSLRVYQHGLKTFLVPSAILNHHLGHPSKRRFLWKIAYVTNYAPYRYYYISRNLAYLHIRKFRSHILHNNHWYNVIWAIIPRYLIKAVLYENRKWEKVRMAARGFFDGVRGRMGKLPDQKNEY